MSKIGERYSTAINASSLKVDGKTDFSNTDVLGAMGVADKRLTAGWITTGPDGEGQPVRPAPLAVTLERLFAGDNRAAHAVVRILADMAFDQSWRLEIKITRPRAYDLARECLAWHRNGRCEVCKGHGYGLIPGVPSLSAHQCPECRGTGRVPLEDLVDPTHRNPGYRELARWLVAEMLRESGRAGPAAMAALAPKLDL